MSARLDPVSAAYIRDPHGINHRLRGDGPVQWSDDLRAWIVTGYDPVREALRDPRLSVEKFAPAMRNLPGPSRHNVERVTALLEDWMVFSDPPRHTRLREAARRMFLPKEMVAMRPRVQAIVDGLLDDLIPQGEMELIHDYAYPIPAAVIGDMLGVPRPDLDRLKLWSDELATFVLAARAAGDRYERAAAATAEMIDYFRGLVAGHRRERRETVTQLLIDGVDLETPLSDDEIVGTLVLLLFAGHETTTNLIGNATLMLLRNPDQQARLRAEPGRIATAVEEFLRIEGALQMLTRLAVEDVELAGQKVAKGERVFLMLTAANRDPARFPEPDLMDIARPVNRHMGFGFGIHLCLGAPLARLETEIAMTALLARADDIRLAADEAGLVWRDEMVVRGVHTLPITFRPTV